MANPKIPPGPGRPKGSKNKETLAREERKAIFDAHISQKFLKLVDKARPEYVLDQFLGKAKETLEISGELTSKVIKLDE